MELTWNDSPDTSSVLFTRDVYDKFSLAPNIKELWGLLHHSPQVKAESQETVGKNREHLPPDPPKPGVGEDTPGVDSDHDSDENPTEIQVKETAPKEASGGGLGVKAVVSKLTFPEPRLPYPCFSAISKQEHNKYMHCLLNRSQIPPQYVVQRIRQEVTEFMKYLQDVSRTCAEDYNYISQGAAQYCEEYLKAFSDHIRTYPQLYLLQETTSLLGTVYMPNLSLNLEKQLLAVGDIDVGAPRILTKDTQLSVDYDCVNSANPPSKRASEAHKVISSDDAAERLSSKYEPDVCLTKEALLQILDQGSEFSEDWELPVWVKVNSLTGKKTVYIDPPLLKKELTMREKNHLFHEESMKLAFNKKDPKPVFFLMTGQRSPEKQPQPKEGQLRRPVATGSPGLDFEVDFTELESFGESLPIKKKTSQGAAQKAELLGKPSVAKMAPEVPEPPNAPQALNTNTVSSKGEGPAKEDALESGSNSHEEDGDSSWTDIEDDSAEEDGDASTEQGPVHASVTGQEKESEEFATPAKRTRTASEASADSDESILYIADMSSPQPHSAADKKLTHPPPNKVTQPAHTAPQPSTPLSLQARAGNRRAGKMPRLEGGCDQLGQILRMQSAMLKHSPSSRTQETPRPAESRPAAGLTEPSCHSLVKSSVTSFLEGKEREDGVTNTGPTLTLHLNTQQKCLLREDLQSTVEDEVDFEAPQEGNLLYKLYSLHDLLLLVRSSISLSHARTSPSGSFCVVPICVLPKLEYQLSYGAECVTSSEACRLWADTLLNPSTVSYIARINAHTSKLVELQDLPPDWMQSISCDFHPARSLNILHHVLKKVTGLPEGRYLMSHKSRMPYFTILKACDKMAAGRHTYDLQSSYGQPPPARTHDAVPWVPVDPNHLLPFHKQHRRVPCTFPPQNPTKPQQGPADHRQPSQKLSKAQKKNKNKKAKKQLKQQQQQKKKM
ncbi:little elongation complex subunit 2 [Clupea harengus]|uniref:Little elongation complex subunit 2 n=1 Tax=Clupea harengus TaxID=7950 RepID=A0A6P8F457_CLUHA|nr:little elongation complex subunit 2 [Clupea harengus]